jgi:hypothetical protein
MAWSGSVAAAELRGIEEAEAIAKGNQPENRPLRNSKPATRG